MTAATSATCTWTRSRVGQGQRVSRGQGIAVSGASGYGDNWYYGPHVHVSLWERPGMPFNQTIDFMNCVGGGTLEPHQRRVVSSAPANGRGDPSTANPATQSLPPGTVANMDGWMYGQDVSGNNMWFHGAISGDWFWSGGFDGGADASNLSDLNAPTMTPTQRYAAAAVNGRARAEHVQRDPRRCSPPARSVSSTAGSTGRASRVTRAGCAAPSPARSSR